MKFYICKTCGKIIAIVKDAVFEIKDQKVFVTVGEVTHPMIPEHYIEWIAIETTGGNQRKTLSPTDEPKACFALCEDEEVKAVYAYCNLHSLWKA